MPCDRDATARWLERRLPRAARRVAMLGDPPPGAADALVARGAVVERLEATASAASAEPPGTAEVLVATASRAADVAATVARASRLLAPRGRLLLLLPAGADTEPPGRLVRGLLEAGFAPRAEPEELGEGCRGVVADFDGYTVRPYRPGDEDAILALFRRSFHVERDRAHWAWKYAANPHGAHRISLARDPGGELVGQYCAYPVRLLQDGREQTVHQVGDIMTAASARGVGRGPTSVFARTARHFYETFCRGQVRFNYGFNTGAHQKLSIRLVGAHQVEEAPLRVRELGRRPARVRRRLLGGCRIAPDPGPDELDRLWREARAAYGSLVVRDARHLRWRYLDRPDQRYLLLGARRRRRLVAWAVFARRGADLVWGDALALPAQVGCLEDLVADAVRRLADGPALERVVGWFPPRPDWLDRCLTELGFELRPEPQQLALMVVPFDDPDAAERCARDFHYTYGDSDLF
ncbi:MAG TPA: GNAT family N-acetyltransferase [Thermoanaerobaculia bacterium]|nr:GNAT family N-acetyltransferase [Thermoanaerobaculia bacterium]